MGSLRSHDNYICRFATFFFYSRQHREHHPPNVNRTEQKYVELLTSTEVYCITVTIFSGILGWRGNSASPRLKTIPSWTQDLKLIPISFISSHFLPSSLRRLVRHLSLALIPASDLISTWAWTCTFNAKATWTYQNFCRTFVHQTSGSRSFFLPLNHHFLHRVWAVRSM